MLLIKSVLYSRYATVQANDMLRRT